MENCEHCKHHAGGHAQAEEAESGEHAGHAEHGHSGPGRSGGNGILIGCALVAFAILVFAGTQVYLAKSGTVSPEKAATAAAKDLQKLKEQILPAKGVELPVAWGDLGKKLTDAGVIDKGQFEAVYAGRGGLDPQTQQMLDGTATGKVRITAQNSGVILNLLWALGLGNKNDILDKGEMADPRYGGADRFASTGGWTLSKGGNPMAHYSKHSLLHLDADAQAKVDRVTRNIYRPCCGNSTHFPDCNHGMAMLGLMELMASQGASEEEMYKAALAVNAYWFPDNYVALGRYLQSKSIAWSSVAPKDLLAANFSSGQGAQQIQQAVKQLDQPQGSQSEHPSSGGCGV